MGEMKEKKKEAGPKKPLAAELCSIRARANLKHAEKEGKKPLCAGCLVKKFTLCRATGHVICSHRKGTGWTPVPFELAQCGLFIEQSVT